MKLTIRKFVYTLKMWLCTGLAFFVLFVSVVIALMSTPYSYIAHLSQAEIGGGLSE